MITQEEVSENEKAASVLEAASALASLGGNVRVDKESSSENETFRCALKTGNDNYPRDSDSFGDDGVKTSTFPEKLMEMLSGAGSDDCMTWLPHGKSFVIVSVEKLARDLLPVYFKDPKFSSFVRKLYRWGFRQIEKGPDAQSFFHRYFQRDNKKMCREMTLSPFFFGSVSNQQQISQEGALRVGENNSLGINASASLRCDDLLLLRRRIAISQARVLAHKRQLSFALDSLPNANESMPLLPARFRRHSLGCGDPAVGSAINRRNQDWTQFENLEKRAKILRSSMNILLHNMSGHNKTRGDNQSDLYSCPLSPDAAQVIQEAVDVL